MHVSDEFSEWLKELSIKALHDLLLADAKKIQQRLKNSKRTGPNSSTASTHSSSTAAPAPA